MPHRQVGGYNKLLYLADMMEALPEDYSPTVHSCDLVSEEDK